MIDDEPLADIARVLRTGDIELGEYLATFEGRVERAEPRIEALLDEPARWDRLQREAGALEARFDDPATRPPLYGVPVGVKDIFNVEGFPMKAGSTVPSETVTGPEADSVRALKEAGALVLGKTVTTEFAYFEPGPTRNPHDPEHTPGGSSSGSAAAVAAGFCPLALGSQTIGSVIRPAAFCGIVGLKPTYGRIPIGGVLPVAPSVDHVGFFTQDVAGAQLAASVLYEHWRPESTGVPTLGVPEGPYLDQADPAAREAFDEQVARLETAGYEVRRVALLEDIDAINDRHQRLVAAETALSHSERFAEHGDRYAEATADLIREGHDVDVGELCEARIGRGALREAVEREMDQEGIDVWVCPGAPGPAPEGIDDTGDPVMNLPWTHCGLPTMALPAGELDGLPLGLQCVARYGEDESLLSWADGIAAAL
ncbi:amidase [Halalkalicoccus jeotgali]|uniref:Amidase n=1 Tax=Halalkalicoccus jeotgali (strain DSM 18796 / CECT 7217 / JCM 14584 / KCTC 4019 / B3) TaxID=795797 RepID=D8JAR4_HALJB|nr:amidase [Halalkalicoccus jeotgali]ADJ14786.1 Amidase [Halalkalicoccus jeotgali B3]ELY39368.1 Amidase [Halalkalicoccus jeotgali B3]